MCLLVVDCLADSGDVRLHLVLLAGRGLLLLGSTALPEGWLKPHILVTSYMTVCLV